MTRQHKLPLITHKKFNKAKYSVFESAANTLGIKDPDLAEAIGYCRNAHNHWKRTGHIPKVAAMAIEGLLRRNNKNEKGPMTFIVKSPQKDLEAVKNVLTALNCDFTEI